MSIGGGASSGNSQTQLDPQIKQDWQSLYDRSVQTADQSVPQQGYAGLNHQQTDAVAGMNGAPNVGAGAIQQGINRADQVGNGVAPINAARVGTDGYSAHEMNPAALAGNAGAIDLGGVPRIQTTDIPGIPNKDGYFSLFDQHVTDPVLQGIDFSRRQGINQNTNDATLQGGAGANLGSRAGVSDSLTNEAAQRQSGQAVSALALPAFQTATGLMEQDQNRATQAKTAEASGLLSAILQNSNTGLTIGKTNADYAQSASAANQAALNAKEQFNAGVNNNAMATNANFAQDAAKTNQNADLSRQGLLLSSAGLLGNLGTTQQNQYLTGYNAMMAGGQAQQQAQQGAYDTAYQNDMNARNLPLQTIESAFGILPTTGSGSVSHSSGKSGNVGLGGRA